MRWAVVDGNPLEGRVGEVEVRVHQERETAEKIVGPGNKLNAIDHDGLYLADIVQFLGRSTPHGRFWCTYGHDNTIVIATFASSQGFVLSTHPVVPS